MQRYEEILRDLYRTGSVSINELIAMTGAIALVVENPALLSLEGYGTCGQEGVVELAATVSK